ncbi:hypothetical protein LOTGIDRAFT_236980 [Lottia gigantea]|uniref:Uncharacterized protein n=1 Tax=Lottia gigantea TaxID=225164 RepID=V3ZNR1_LOTGI|nr:hypothetical protein LOTGIDRAFT_236980 [Lottia gigantea]ESO82501.1 hypothetical protein LOTGIDRAFT_236980 [Lottia gigantea]
MNGCMIWIALMALFPVVSSRMVVVPREFSTGDNSMFPGVLPREEFESMEREPRVPSGGSQDHLEMFPSIKVFEDEENHDEFGALYPQFAHSVGLLNKLFTDQNRVLQRAPSNKRGTTRAQRVGIGSFVPGKRSQERLPENAYFTTFKELLGTKTRVNNPFKLVDETNDLSRNNNRIIRLVQMRKVGNQFIPVRLLNGLIEK